MTMKRNLLNFLMCGACMACISLLLVQKAYAGEIWRFAKAPVPPKEVQEEAVVDEEPEEIVAEIKPPVAETETKPEEKVYTFTDCDPSYFDDALFVGDSRTVGLYEYGNLVTASYFADVGMNLYKLEHVTVPVAGQEMTLKEVLGSKDFSKIYLMLGINELGYDFDTTVKKYGELIEKLHTAHPDAIIYLCANMHMTKARSDSEVLFNNTNIDRFNAEVAKLADQETFFYLDVNEIFDDEEGNLAEEYTVDNAHVLGKYYIVWCDWLCTKAIIK